MATIKIYVCGITPYDTTHLGHAFTYISFDVLIRFLNLKGNRVIYTQNITDINDRDQDILQRAKEQNVSWQKLAEFWTKRFLDDMENLNWVFPTHLIKASESIDEIVKLIKRLLMKGLAYQVKGSVYLNIAKFPSYGKLSNLSRPQMIKIAKEFEEDLENPDKKDPLDITLWRQSSPNQEKHIPAFPSPFGAGRPGWHIECSAMAISTLGEQIDIHGGGIDLIFPHHEAEIVQSEGATGKVPFVKKWMHTAIVSYRGEKMSKSKGNLVLVSDLLKKYSANAIRWLLLSHHYNEPWEFKEQDLVKVQKQVQEVERTLALQGQVLEADHNDYNLKQFIKLMDQDLNTPEVLQLLLKKPDRRIYEALGFRNS